MHINNIKKHIISYIIRLRKDIFQKKKKNKQTNNHKTKQGDMLVHIEANTPKGNHEGMNNMGPKSE